MEARLAALGNPASARFLLRYALLPSPLAGVANSFRSLNRFVPFNMSSSQFRFQRGVLPFFRKIAIGGSNFIPCAHVETTMHSLFAGMDANTTLPVRALSSSEANQFPQFDDNFAYLRRFVCTPLRTLIVGISVSISVRKSWVLLTLPSHSSGLN
jgi:hypothetical protein